MRLLFWRKKAVKSGCECEEYCSCRTPDDKELICEKCKHYRMIDSGYGYCIALPAVTTVPWCRITCSLFRLHKPTDERR